jgi:hypothetical protein
LQTARLVDILKPDYREEEYMSRKFSILLSIILLMGLLLAPAGNVAAQSVEPVSKESAAQKGILPAPAPNLIQDPSLAAAYHNPTIWKQASTNADWTVCTTSNTVDCLVAGVAGPRTGTKWGFFGILDWEDPETESPEEGDLYQNVTFPGCGASLQFYFWIGQAPAGSNANDKFQVLIDDVKIFEKSALDAASYSSYTLVSLDVSNFADGAVHKVEFYSITADQAVIFNLDDISLTQTCVTISGNAGIGGATLDYTGGSTTANGSGNYSFDVAYDWSGTVTPSKPGYTFSPVNRTYTNLTTDQTGQNYAATGPTISGNVGVSGVTLSYSDGTPKTATSDPNGNYSFMVTGNWSGTVTPSHPCYTFTPADRSYSNVIADQTAQDYTLTPIPAAGCAEISVDIAGNSEGTFPITSQGTLTQKFFPGINKGPVKIYSTVPILGAERVIYSVSGVPVSFSEMMGLPASHLDNIYWLPWYNNKDLNTQLRIANVSATDATVHVSIGGTEVTGSPYTLTPGTSRRLSYANLDKGPVKIESDVDIVAAERVIYTVNGVPTSFTEMMAMPESKLDNLYWLPWYNNKDLNTQLRIANVSATDATVHVSIGGTEVTGSPYTLTPGASRRLSYANLDKGPVKIESDVNIVAAERVIYTVNGVATSFTEMMALPESQLDMTYWLPRYNNVDLDSQLRIANVEATDATVHVYMGGVEITGSPFTVLAGKSIRKSFPGINKGLVKVESDVNIVAAERVIYTVNGVPTSFTEMMGLPAGQLDMTYWLPWYNNVELDTHLRFGLP